MKNAKLISAMLLSSSLLVSLNTFAKDEHPRREEINHRVRSEERRIDRALKDGKITAAQAKQMKSELAGVKGEEVAEVKANGGYLTKTEQKQLNQELNQDSRQIYLDQHPRQAEVDGRINNQEKRISAGVKDGELSSTEAKQLRGEEAGVFAQEKSEVKANGGYLTKGEQKQLNKELNQDSKQIHTDRVAGE